MAIVTSKFKASCQRGLRCLGLEDCIDDIIGCQECTAHKPDPEPMEKGLELLGLRGEECLCVGDSPYDLVSGKKSRLPDGESGLDLLLPGFLRPVHPA